ncbi:MAG: hypothetical protein SOZ59_13245 [Candidatus Limivivens sp.]|nr:hypothetical protein [Candidatus Limivivens sp.]
MDEIVKRLSEIETEAVRIMEDSAVQKKEMEEASQERIRKYDEEVDTKTAAELARLKASLETKMEKELAKLRSDTDRMIQALEADYAANHRKMADQVLQEMIEG